MVGSVYSAVRTDWLYNADYVRSLKVSSNLGHVEIFQQNSRIAVLNKLRSAVGRNRRTDWRCVNILDARTRVVMRFCFAELRKKSVFISVYPSAWNNLFDSGWIFTKFCIWVFFENVPKKLKFHYNLTKKIGTLYVGRYIFLIISREILLRIRNVQTTVVHRYN